jgi:hypothetical protein
MQGSLRGLIPRPQPIDLDSAKEHAQPCGARIATPFEHPSPLGLEQSLKMGQAGWRKEEDQIDVLGGPADPPGLKSGATG